jgi:tetratricopeptide (TPR) repeat protein
MTTRTLSSLAFALALALVAEPASTQERQLGWIEFGNSGAAAAQKDFIEGALLLHSFEFEDAATAFRRAQSVDPSFALAFWGEAMSYNHPLWRQQDKPAALAALNRFAASPAQRQSMAPTPREAAYLQAVDVLYGDGSKSERDRAYMDAMARIADAYPQDLEARAFYALAILGSTDGERDFATYMRAAVVAQTVFNENAQHPGAVHYIIHSFDDPIHAPLGLEAARAYAGIAPGAGHAQHMTSHIFVAMGMWDDLVAANIRARDVQNARNAELGRKANVCGHYTSWLHYGWLQRGEIEKAEQGMAECHDRVLEGGAPDEVGYFVAMRARHVLDLGDWDAADRLSADVSDPRYDFITGVAAIKRGDRAGAQAALTRMPTEGNPRGTIARQELAALIAVDDGDRNGAIGLLTEAAALEETLPFEFGPPASPQPPHELLGAVYLTADRPADAVVAFRKALEFTPDRMASLVGLAAASQAAGDVATVNDIMSRLQKNLQHGDAAFLSRMGFGGERR